MRAIKNYYKLIGRLRRYYLDCSQNKVVDLGEKW